jgi:hypothetical protein
VDGPEAAALTQPNEGRGVPIVVLANLCHRKCRSTQESFTSNTAPPFPASKLEMDLTPGWADDLHG